MFDGDRNVHPGEILETCYLENSEETAKELDDALNCDVKALLALETSIGKAEAKELAEHFGTPERSWIQLQLEYSAEKQRQADPTIKGRLEK